MFIVVVVAMQYYENREEKRKGNCIGIDFILMKK